MSRVSEAHGGSVSAVADGGAGSVRIRSSMEDVFCSREGGVQWSSLARVERVGDITLQFLGRQTRAITAPSSTAGKRLAIVHFSLVWHTKRDLYVRLSVSAPGRGPYHWMNCGTQTSIVRSSWFDGSKREEEFDELENGALGGKSKRERGFWLTSFKM